MELASVLGLPHGPRSLSFKLPCTCDILSINYQYWVKNRGNIYGVVAGCAFLLREKPTDNK